MKPIILPIGTVVYPLQLEDGDTVHKTVNQTYFGLSLIATPMPIIEEVEVDGMHMYTSSRPKGALPAFAEADTNTTRCITRFRLGFASKNSVRIARHDTMPVAADSTETYVAVDEKVIETYLFDYKNAIYSLATDFVYCRFRAPIREFWGFAVAKRTVEKL